MRENLVKSRLLEAVIGLGPGLFYNSPMEAIVVVLRSQRPADQRDSVLFINAIDQVARERAQSFLNPGHRSAILSAYESFTDDAGFAAVATIDDIAGNAYSLAIPLYVASAAGPTTAQSIESIVSHWRAAAAAADNAVRNLLESFDAELGQ